MDSIERGCDHRRREEPAEAIDNDVGYPIIAHSHLWWDWVWQRPQQFLSRLSRRHPVLYVEIHPGTTETAASASWRDIPGLNVAVLAMRFPPGLVGNALDEERRRLLRDALQGPRARRFEFPVQWFYDPMAVTAFAGHLETRATVYDCMDQLSQFRGAPPEIVDRERILLSVADVVFTGGRKLWEAKRAYNTNCYFYGCGVEVDHFRRALDPNLKLPADIEALAKPIAGYFGVVDERLDYGLIARLAEDNPSWNLVMVGPRTKVEVSELPVRPNLHWLGGRPYADLPAYAKAFDVCLMPFALNDATEYINPTKALEYMATARPIVSTAVPDVVTNFGDIVRVGHSAEEFIAHCRQCVTHRDSERIDRGVQLAQSNTWDSIVEKLEEHVWHAMAKKHGQRFFHAPFVELTSRGGHIDLPLPVIGSGK